MCDGFDVEELAFLLGLADELADEYQARKIEKQQEHDRDFEQDDEHF
jgi:hypothetical protein